jgi:hypothetical protein
MDPYSPHSREEGTEIRAFAGTVFEADFGSSLLQKGHPVQSVHQPVGTNFKVLCFSGWVILLYGFGTFSKAEIVGTVWVL